MTTESTRYYYAVYGEVVEGKIKFCIAPETSFDSSAPVYDEANGGWRKVETGNEEALDDEILDLLDRRLREIGVKP